MEILCKQLLCVSLTAWNPGEYQLSQGFCNIFVIFVTSTNLETVGNKACFICYLTSHVAETLFLQFPPCLIFFQLKKKLFYNYWTLELFKCKGLNVKWTGSLACLSLFSVMSWTRVSTLIRKLPLPNPVSQIKRLMVMRGCTKFWQAFGCAPYTNILSQ